MRITVLTENTACDPKFSCEHGLSLYIETAGKKILFDTGQTAAFASNAEKLGTDLSQVDFCVLSHGHYDHGGGLAHFLNVNHHAKIYASACAFGQHYHGREKYIGLDQSLDRERFVFVSGKTEPAPGICMDPCLERTDNVGSQGMLVRKGEVWEPEAFRHELYLLIQEGERRYLFSGCSHRGAVNIASWFQPDVFIGGFHLSKEENEAVLISTAQALARFHTTYYTGHCTGEMQFALMKAILNERLNGLPTGTVLML